MFIFILLFTFVWGTKLFDNRIDCWFWYLKKSAWNFYFHLFRHPSVARGFLFFFPLSCSYWRVGKINHVLCFIHFIKFLFHCSLIIFPRKISWCRPMELIYLLIIFIIIKTKMFDFSYFFSFRYSTVRLLVLCIRRHQNLLSLTIQHHQIQHFYLINPYLQSTTIPLY